MRVQDSLNPSASVVSYHHNMAHLRCVHRLLDDRQAGQVRVNDQICDIAMNVIADQPLNIVHSRANERHFS
jgi:hypothetical protein